VSPDTGRGRADLDPVDLDVALDGHDLRWARRNGVPHRDAREGELAAGERRIREVEQAAVVAGMAESGERSRHAETEPERERREDLPSHRNASL